MPREKTNSITHLVKIVAEEVYNEKFYINPARFEAMIKREIRNYFDSTSSMIQQEIESYFASMRLPRVKEGKRSGEYWTAKEDNYLRLLFKEFCNRTAEEFGRSTGAIEARINQKLV